MFSVYTFLQFRVMYSLNATSYYISRQRKLSKESEILVQDAMSFM